jgi:quinol monooxygenase YgiN
MAGRSRPKDGVASARLCPGHPRLLLLKFSKDVDTRDKPGHDGDFLDIYPSTLTEPSVPLKLAYSLHRRSTPIGQHRSNTMDNSANQSLVVTAFWQANPGEEAAIAGLLKEFLPQARREPGVKEFQIHQNTTKPNEFFFYEVFAGEAAFADHQQTRHFKDIIVGQAIPKLAKRERAQFRFI